VHGSSDSPETLLAGLLPGDETGRLILVSGPSGCGKTRWCQAFVENARARSIPVRGLISPAVFEGGEKTGIDLLDLGSGQRRRLAIRGGKSSHGQTTSCWQFNEHTLTWGNLMLRQVSDCQVLVLDELGPLEFAQGAGLTDGMALISARGYRLACVVVRPGLLEEARVLWPWGETWFVPCNTSAEDAA
jgi:nucleoside-triphosphatase